MAKLKYIIVAVLIVITAFLLSRSATLTDSKKMSISDKELLTVSEVSDKSIFFSDTPRKKLKKISASGVLEMYLDESTLAICIYDTISGKMWRSLPKNNTGVSSANLTANVIIKGCEYTLNSQSDSLAFGSASYDIKDDTLIISYSFRRNLENGKKIDLTVPLELKLADGALSAQVNCKKIADNSTAKVYLKSLSVLPFFGAGNEGKKGDYILLPSASGIILDTYKKTKSFDEISLPVYGEDISKNKEVSSFVPIGVFGMKVADNAFICLIDKGESVACIKASKASDKTNCNYVGTEFELTSTTTDGKSLYLSENSYNGTLSLSYRFLSGNNADYITMAGACRELLIRQGKLSDGTLTDGDYPFKLTLIGSTPEKGTTTSDEEAKELISSLMTKGINNIDIILKDSDKRNVTTLSDFTSKNNLNLSLWQNLFSYSKKSALTLSGEKNSMGLGISSAEKNAGDIINSMRENSVGVCLGDCASVLPSDYRKFNFTDRNKMLSDISELCTSISSHGALTVSSANIYAVKYADSIINIPEKSPLEENSYCKPIPFLQAVLHGICDYSFTAINLSSNPTEAMLKAIEYGAVPHYEWYFAQYEENDPLHYMGSLSQARPLYENMKKMFSDLRDQRITSHEEVKKNVTCTVYSSGSEIYVNYNNEAVTIGGITIDPLGFLRVN